MNSHAGSESVDAAELDAFATNGFLLARNRVLFPAQNTRQRALAYVCRGNESKPLSRETESERVREERKER